MMNKEISTEEERKNIENKVNRLVEIVNEETNPRIVMSILCSFFCTSIISLAPEKEEESSFESMCSYMHDHYIEHPKIKENRLLETKEEHIERIKRSAILMMNYMMNVSVDPVEDVPKICINFLNQIILKLIEEESRMIFIEGMFKALKEVYKKEENKTCTH